MRHYFFRIVRLHIFHCTRTIPTNDGVIADSPSGEQSTSFGTDAVSEVGRIVGFAQVNEGEGAGEDAIVGPGVGVEVLAEG